METYDVKLIERPTGRTHTVVGHGIQPILDESTGEPETEFALVAEVEGHYITLGTYTAGYVQHLVGSEITAVDASSSSGTSTAQPGGDPLAAPAEQTAAPAEGQGTAGEGAAQPPQPPAAG